MYFGRPLFSYKHLLTFDAYNNEIFPCNVQLILLIYNYVLSNIHLQPSRFTSVSLLVV